MQDYAGSICDNILFPTDCDSLTQLIGCDPATPSCQGAGRAAMAVGESQLQRIIRDLHGMSALFLDRSVIVCMLECYIMNYMWLRLNK